MRHGVDLDRGLTLAQSAADAKDILVWVIVLIVSALVGGLVILVVRKRMLAPDASNELASEGLFDSLRRMRDSGEISRDEYEHARKRLIESATKPKAGPAMTQDQASILAAARQAEFGLGRSEARKMEAPPGYDLTGSPLPRGQEPGKGSSGRGQSSNG